MRIWNLLVSKFQGPNRSKTRGGRLEKPRLNRLSLEALEERTTPTNFAQFVDPSPSANNGFGTHIIPLSTGNVVITAPRDDAGGTDAGAVYLFNGATGALISTLKGSTANDNVGLTGVTALTNGNFVVNSPYWDNPNRATNAGAVTWGSGSIGVNGVVSDTNSLVGATTNDQIASGGVTALINGNYMVNSPSWDNGANSDVGAVTLGGGTVGAKGLVSSANSLVGTTADDQIGSDVTALTNGNFVVQSPVWDNQFTVNVGAVTWGNGTVGVKGFVSSANSLVGATANDLIGSGGVTALTNGNFVVKGY